MPAITWNRSLRRVSGSPSRLLVHVDILGMWMTYPSVLAGHRVSTLIVVSLPDRSARINHGSATLLTVQVARGIEADIAGRLAPDTRLPGEGELAAQYGVARVTVRGAIQQLRDRGKVVTVHGRGTYVAS
jgi:Bacterial regulatory proteins, gntR family